MSPLFYIVLLIGFLCIQAYFCMMEMAAISYNPLRLAYFLSKQDGNAEKLSYLLKRPSRLFGTTLFGVNAALQFGSESARKFYASMGVDPDFAPLTQIIIVLLFAEFIPMFLGRFYSETVLNFGVKILYFFSRLFFPITWLIDRLSALVDLLLGHKRSHSSYLSRQELQKAFELFQEGSSGEISRIWEGVFAIQKTKVIHIAKKMEEIPSLEPTATVMDLKNILRKDFLTFVPIICASSRVVHGIVYPRDLLRLSDHGPLIYASHSPHFISEHATVNETLGNLRQSNQRVAVLLSSQGRVTGFVTLDDLIGALGHFDREVRINQVYIDRSFSKETTIGHLRSFYNIELPGKEDQTLEELMVELLGHYPARGESLFTHGIEMTFHEEGGVFDEKKITLTTVAHQRKQKEI